MIDVRDLAKYTINYANRKQISITNLKLQKILYYIAGVYAGVYNKRLFSENIEAWQYGPVVRSVYVEYCANGPLALYVDEKPTLECTSEELSLFDFVIDNKITMTGRELVNATHREAPWRTHRNEYCLKPSISFEEIRDYFKDSEEVRRWNLRQTNKETMN